MYKMKHTLFRVLLVIFEVLMLRCPLSKRYVTGRMVHRMLFLGRNFVSFVFFVH